MAKSRAAVIDSMRRVLDKPVGLDAVLSKAGQRDRANVEKHLAALDADAGSPHGELWRRVIRSLATLAPLAISTVGQQAVQFFIADGKYRMQVFALEDLHDGRLMLYLPDVLDDAVKHKIVIADQGEPDEETGGAAYSIAAAKGQTIHLEQLTSSNTTNPAPYYKNMLGWNRKALRITIPITATTQQVEVAEDLAALASKAWEGKPQTQTPHQSAASQQSTAT